MKPEVRLAYHPEGDRKLKHGSTPPTQRERLELVNGPSEKSGTLDCPAIRLAVSPHSEQGGANSVEHYVTNAGLGHAATIRLAVAIEG